MVIPMLTPGLIPRKEPYIRVGLILPEDNKSSVMVHFTNPDCIEIETGSRFHPSCKTPEDLSIVLSNQHLTIPEINIMEDSLRFIPSIPDENPIITIKGVPAGRGFHWEKEIHAAYWGAIEFSIYDGQLICVNELPLEQYLKCVATSEMSPQCPPEFLRAQTIVARSWLLANIEQKHRHLGFDICNDDCCQRYQGMANCTDASIQSANATHGKVIIYDNQICDARYSKSCGGITENYEHVWDGDSVPYLVSISDKNENGVPFCSPEVIPEELLNTYIGNVDEKGQYFRWTYVAKESELIQSLRQKQNITATKIQDLSPIKMGLSARIIDLSIKYEDGEEHDQEIIIHSEYEIRNIMSPSFLYSSAFSIEKTPNGNFLLHGKGWGHGAGLCQIGALGMALSNHTTEEILTHYYPNIKLDQIYIK